MHQPLTRAAWRHAHRTVRALSRSAGFDSYSSYASQAREAACQADARNNVLLSLPPKARALLAPNPGPGRWAIARRTLLQLLAYRRNSVRMGFRQGSSVEDYMQSLRGARGAA